MRKRDLIVWLRAQARRSGKDFELKREGGNHEIWAFGSTLVKIPRHVEIKELTARRIMKEVSKELEK